MTKPLIYNQIMHDLYTIFVKHLDICKNFASELVNENGNINRKCIILRFSDLEVIALSMTVETLGIDDGETYFCIDSKPIEICRIARGNRFKMGKADYEKAPIFGYCSSQKTRYYGYKLHVISELSEVIHSYDLTKTSVHDIKYLNDVKMEFHDCSIFGDRGYIDKEIQLDLFETTHIKLECPYRLNQKDCKPQFIPFAKARKGI